MSIAELCAELEEDLDLLLHDCEPTEKEKKISIDIREALAYLDEKYHKLKPKFPYKIEKAIWYLLFLFQQGIITDEEYDKALDRLKEKLGPDFMAKKQ